MWRPVHLHGSARELRDAIQGLRRKRGAVYDAVVYMGAGLTQTTQLLQNSERMEFT